MDILEAVITFICFLLLTPLIWFIHKVWWTPIHIQSVMRSQGIKGPSYKFLHGNTKEIIKLRKESTDSLMDLSHNIFPRIQPHIYSWIKLYGKLISQYFFPEC